MISDNFVVGDNVYLNELKNFFFEVLGMMSVTHYGAIGDGRTDNYASLQVAIDDANRRGLCYIYVPYGRYRFRGNLINRDNITFIGNPRAKIFNDRTGEEIEIKQFGVPGCGTHTCKMTFLSKNLILADGVAPTLDSGSYFTDAYVVKINGNIVLQRGVPFYYDKNTKTLSWLTGYAKYKNGVWTVYEGIAPEEDDDMKAFMTAELLGEPPHPETGVNVLKLTNFISGGTMRELLTFDENEGKIVIGENVTQISIGGMLRFTPFFSQLVPEEHQERTFSIYRERDGVELQLAVGEVRFYRTPSLVGPITIAIPPKIVAVTGGDKIYIVYDKFDSNDWFEQKTYLTVEALTYDENPTPQPST